MMVSSGQICDYVQKIKQRGELISNIYPGVVREDVEYEGISGEEAVAFFDPNEYPARRIHFAGLKESAEMIDLLKKMPSSTSIHWIEKQEECSISSLLEASEYKRYKCFIRHTTVFKENPYEKPEEGRRKILFGMYDRDCGEYPEESDAEYLRGLNLELFDIYADDIFTLDEWKQIIREKRCLIYREDGEIMAVGIWKIEGKKLYYNFSYNSGPANYLYNMERRVFEACWNNNIRTMYAWFDTENTKALQRGESIRKRGMDAVLFDHIFVKQ